MNAKEMAKQSEAVAEQLEKDEKKRQQENALKKKIKEADEVKKYERNILKDAEWSIKNAAENGEKKTSIHLLTTDIPYESYPDWFMKNYLYAPLVQQLMDKLKDDGFTVELAARTNTYRTEHESGPDYNYYDYDTILKISW